MERIGANHTQHSTERGSNMKRAARASARLRTSQGGRPCKPAKILPTIRRKDLPVVHLPRQTRSQGGKTKLTNHRAAVILHAISCGCYRETAAELASIKAETLSHWMGWSGEPYEPFSAWCHCQDATEGVTPSIRSRPKRCSKPAIGGPERPLDTELPEGMSTEA